MGIKESGSVLVRPERANSVPGKASASSSSTTSTRFRYPHVRIQSLVPIKDRTSGLTGRGLLFAFSLKLIQVSPWSSPQTPAPSDDSYPPYPSLASMFPTLTTTTTTTASTESNSSPAPYALNPHSLQLTTRPPPTYRGVFTSPLQTLPAGTLIETAPVLVIPAHEWEFGKKTALDHYAFVWGRRGDMAVAFGLGVFPCSLSSSLHLRRTPLAN